MEFRIEDFTTESLSNDFELFYEHLCGFDLESEHQEWYKHLRSEKCLSIWSKRNNSKTFLTCIAYPLWLIGNNINTRVVVVSNTVRASISISASIGEQVISKAYQGVFPHVSSNKSLIECFGFCSQNIMGLKADVLIFDDIVIRNESDLFWFNEVVLEFGRTSESQIVAIGTSTSSSDLLHYIEENKNWKTIKPTTT